MISLVSVGAIGAFFVADASAQRNGGRDRQDSVRSEKRDNNVDQGNRGRRPVEAAPSNTPAQTERQRRPQQNIQRDDQMRQQRDRRQIQDNTRQEQAQQQEIQRQRDNQIRQANDRRKMQEQQNTIRQQNDRNVWQQQQNDQRRRDEELRQARERRQIRDQQNTIRQQPDRTIYNNDQGDRRVRGQQNSNTRNQQIDRSEQRRMQQNSWNQYNNRWGGNWQTIQKERYRQLEAQRRRAYLRYQQRYWERVRRDQIRLQQAQYYDYYYNNYRYNRGGSYYYTSQYGAQMLRDAINNGYEEGFYAGQADREDGWDFDYRNSYGYQDAAFGYDSYYVSMEEYNYYFREGFRRGYEDGYYSRNRYGNYSNGKYSILGAIVGTILDLVTD